MAKAESEPTVAVEEDEQDSKEAVLQRYFLQEWEQVKSILHTILSDRRVIDLSSVRKIRSIVSLISPHSLSLSLSLISSNLCVYTCSISGYLLNYMCVTSSCIVEYAM